MAARATATDIAAINAAVAASAANAKRRRTRNGSARQISHNSGTATSPATISCDLQPRKHREQERKRIAVDDQEVEERQRSAAGCRT